ncbi:hypothetical protein MPSEU_000968700 [Mayamaea pseudoterrestris]|nr:hypothetical protein MPSEU_000968700 [Mayamaea pseudoterrestris]
MCFRLPSDQRLMQSNDGVNSRGGASLPRGFQRLEKGKNTTFPEDELLLAMHFQNESIAEVFAVASIRSISMAFLMVSMRKVPSLRFVAGLLVLWLQNSLSPGSLTNVTVPSGWKLYGFATLIQSLACCYILSSCELETISSALLTTTLATCGVSVYAYRGNNQPMDLTEVGPITSAMGIVTLLNVLVYFLVHCLGWSAPGLLPTDWFEVLNSWLLACTCSSFLVHDTCFIEALRNTAELARETGELIILTDT